MALGSVTSITTSAGAIGNTYRYDSFGNLTASSGSIVNRFQYSGARIRHRDRSLLLSRQILRPHDW